ncbi:MAG: hypothetical protein Q9175_008317 [Cornicularia normoerica]
MDQAARMEGQVMRKAIVGKIKVPTSMFLNHASILSHFLPCGPNPNQKMNWMEKATMVSAAVWRKFLSGRGIDASDIHRWKAVDHEGTFSCMDPFAHFDTLGLIRGEEVVRLAVTLAEIPGRNVYLEDGTVIFEKQRPFVIALTSWALKPLPHYLLDYLDHVRKHTLISASSAFLSASSCTSEILLKRNAQGRKKPSPTTSTTPTAHVVPTPLVHTESSVTLQRSEDEIEAVGKDGSKQDEPALALAQDDPASHDEALEEHESWDFVICRTVYGNDDEWRYFKKQLWEHVEHECVAAVSVIRAFVFIEEDRAS